MESFVHLHVYTQFSLLDGQSGIDALIEKAQQDGMKAFAVRRLYYRQHISLDVLFYFNIPVSEITFDKGVSKSIAREKLLSQLYKSVHLSRSGVHKCPIGKLVLSAPSR